MRIIDKKTMERFRQADFCEFCGLSSALRKEPHHVFGRGHAGAWRLDVSWALMAMCGAFRGGNCHWLYGDKPDFLGTFLRIVANRERCTPEDLIAARDLLRRLPKETTREQANAALAEIGTLRI